MTIITISRGSYSRGKEIAEKVAERLGYACVAREILLEASEEYDIPEIKLIRAIHDAPSILSRLGYKKDRYVSYIRTALLKHLMKDNVVYHGLAGHFFLQGIPHVLKVRIVADMFDRVRLEMEREHIPREEALALLRRDDGERRKWSQSLYGIDTRDPNLYDLVVNTKTITPGMAVEIILCAAGMDRFRTTPESSRMLEDRFRSFSGTP